MNATMKDASARPAYPGMCKRPCDAAYGTAITTPAHASTSTRSRGDAAAKTIELRVADMRLSHIIAKSGRGAVSDDGAVCSGATVVGVGGCFDAVG